MNRLILKYSYENNHDDYLYDNNSYTAVGLFDDVPENQDRFENEKRNGDDFDPSSPEIELARLIKERKSKRNNKKQKQKQNTFEPHPFYTSQYGYQGLDGTFSTPLAYYSGTIIDGPDNVQNPYNTPYQSASLRQERILIRTAYLKTTNQ
jgi:hypothetical protein